LLLFFIACYFISFWQRELFEVDIRSTSGIQEKYNKFRSFWRGSELRAVAQGVSESDRYVLQRWRRKEVSGNNKVRHPTSQGGFGDFLKIN
jgi:hypothetical protein